MSVALGIRVWERQMCSFLIVNKVWRMFVSENGLGGLRCCKHQARITHRWIPSRYGILLPYMNIHVILYLVLVSFGISNITLGHHHRTRKRFMSSQLSIICYLTTLSPVLLTWLLPSTPSNNKKSWTVSPHAPAPCSSRETWKMVHFQDRIF